MGTAIYKLSGKINFQVKKTHIPEGKYICHSYCRDLVHLDYPQNGKLPSCTPAGEVRHSGKKNTQACEGVWLSVTRAMAGSDLISALSDFPYKLYNL